MKHIEMQIFAFKFWKDVFADRLIYYICRN